LLSYPTVFRSPKVMASWRREPMEAMRKGQTTKLAKLKEAQQGFLKDTMEMQTTPLKSMAWTLFLFIVIFTWLRLFVDVTLSNLGNQWIAVPWSDHVFLNSAYLFPSWSSSIPSSRSRSARSSPES